MRQLFVNFNFMILSTPDKSHTIECWGHVFAMSGCGNVWAMNNWPVWPIISLELFPSRLFLLLQSTGIFFYGQAPRSVSPRSPEKSLLLECALHKAPSSRWPISCTNPSLTMATYKPTSVTSSVILSDFSVPVVDLYILSEPWKDLSTFYRLLQTNDFFSSSLNRLCCVVSNYIPR